MQVHQRRSLGAKDAQPAAGLDAEGRAGPLEDSRPMHSQFAALRLQLEEIRTRLEQQQLEQIQLTQQVLQQQERQERLMQKLLQRSVLRGRAPGAAGRKSQALLARPGSEASSEPSRAAEESEGERPGLVGAISAKIFAARTPGPDGDDDPAAGTASEMAERAAAEPARAATWSARLRRLVLSDAFECVAGALILANTMTMAAKAQLEGMQTGCQLGFPGSTCVPGDFESAFGGLQTFFTAAFCVEAVLRLAALRQNFFCSGWNLLDLFVCVLTVLELGKGGSVAGPAVLRLLRLIKLIRCLKVLRAATHFLDCLNLIVKSVAASHVTLFWSMLILFGVQSVAAIGAVQLFQDVLLARASGGALAPEVMESSQRIYAYWGTFGRAMITMFEVTDANYATASRIVTDSVNEHYGWFFILYRCLVSFAMLNVIRAVFIQQTLKVAERDRDLSIRAQHRSDQLYRKELLRIFKEINAGNEGQLTQRQWDEALKKPMLKQWLRVLDIGHSDVQGLFQLLDRNGSGGIEADEFVLGATRLKGQARAIDLFHLSSQVVTMDSKLQRLMLEYDLELEAEAAAAPVAEGQVSV